MQSKKNPFPKKQQKDTTFGTEVSKPLQSFDFSNQNADGEDLSGLDLRYVDFRGASLVGVDFTHSDLHF